MHINKRVVLIWILLFVVAWGIWCAFFLPRGLEPNHEGFYLSEASRFALGDLPFQDSTTSSVTLVYWWESWLLRICPGCGFLDLRIVWAIMMSLCALIIFILMRRYFSSLVSFTSSIASLLFIDAVTYVRAPSYYSATALPLLLGIWLWVIAYHRSGKAQLLLAAGAGAAAFLATTCKITLIFIILLPIITMIYDRFCGVKVDGIRRMAITFFITYLVCVACFFAVVGSAGLIGEFFEGWGVSSDEGYGLVQMFNMMIWSSLFILLPGLVIVSIMAFLRYKENLRSFWLKHRERTKHRIPVIIACVLMWILNFNLFWLFSILAIGIILRDVVFRLFNHAFNLETEEDVVVRHDRCRLGVIAIFLYLLTVLGTTVFPPWQAVFENSWLVVGLAVGLFCIWFPKLIDNARHILFLRGVCTVIIVVSLTFNIGMHSNPWHEGPIGELTASPSAARAHGILTTPERAKFIDCLVDAIERNSKVGDRILAFLDVPWVYGLTNRLPSTHRTWILALTTESTQQVALNNMIERDRLPQLVVHCPNGTWGTTPRVPNGPLYQYVKDRYEVVEACGECDIMLPVAVLNFEED